MNAETFQDHDFRQTLNNRKTAERLNEMTKKNQFVLFDKKLFNTAFKQPEIKKITIKRIEPGDVYLNSIV